MSVTAVRTPAEYESQLRRYLYDRSEEGRAVRVGEKEVSERAEIVARYRDLFSRDQIDALRSAENDASDADERERLYRLRKTCEAGFVAAELAEREDMLENAILAARVEFHEGACGRGLHGHGPESRLRPRERQQHPPRPRRPAAEVAAGMRDPLGSAGRRPPDHACAGRPARLPGVPARGGARAP